MPYSESLMQEINLLLKFPDTSMEGLKVHHTAESSTVDAASRLFEKGLTTQVDGGYLTDRGREAALLAGQLAGLMTATD